MSRTDPSTRSAARRAPVVALALTTACGAPPPENLGPTGNGLASCPDVPNCVHTGDPHPEELPPLVVSEEWRARPHGELWNAIEAAVEGLPRTEVVAREGPYLHAESRSTVFRFVDDLEIYHEEGNEEIVVRSASRVGRSDMGVNIRRVEELRQALARLGAIR